MAVAPHQNTGQADLPEPSEIDRVTTAGYGAHGRIDVDTRVMRARAVTYDNFADRLESVRRGLAPGLRADITKRGEDHAASDETYKTLRPLLHHSTDGFLAALGLVTAVVEHMSSTLVRLAVAHEKTEDVNTAISRDAHGHGGFRP
ncbi:hypothetical protein ACQPYE_17340 [Actinosynnema sp. CA-299493]